MTNGPFRVALAPDFAPGRDGSIPATYGLDRLLGAPGVFSEVVDLPAELPASVADEFDALLLMDQKVTAATVASPQRLRLVARYGVGTNSVDLDACAASGVLVTITPEGVTRPVASGALTLLLMTMHRAVEKQRLLLSGEWSRRGNVIGWGLTGKRIVIVGMGRTGCELGRLLQPWGAVVVGYDPYVDPQVAASVGVQLASLDTALDGADAVCLMAALTPETHHLLSRERIASLKSGAVVVNVSRGRLADTTALAEAIRSGQIGGAGLDVFETEPPPTDDPLLELAATHNVVVTPHSMVWTDECFRGNGGSATQAIIDVAHGVLPAHIVNQGAIAHPRQAGLKW